MASNSKRESLPFEPKSNKRLRDQGAEDEAVSSTAKVEPSEANRKQSKSQRKSSASSQENSLGIPEVVSRRMMRRMAVFAGIPTFLGMASFVVAYILLIRNIVEVPNVVVLLVSLAGFGLGTVGLSYGVLSASWQEDTAGSLLGFEEFSVNFRRLIQGLRSKQKPDSSAES